MASQTQTRKSESWDRVVVVGFVLIGIAFVAYFALAIVEKWQSLNFFVMMSPLFAAMLVCVIMMAYLFRKAEKASKAITANKERIRNAPISVSAGIFLMNLEMGGFNRLAWQIRKKAVDGDSDTRTLLETTWNSLQVLELSWGTDQVIQAFLATIEENVGGYFGYKYAQGVLVGLAKDRIGLANPQRVFMVNMLRLLYPNLTEWKLFGTNDQTNETTKDS